MAIPEYPPYVDEVNKPEHYLFGPYETIDIIEEWLRANDVTAVEGLIWGSLVQYIFRFKKKRGLKDLKKAEWYLKRLMEISNENV